MHVFGTMIPSSSATLLPSCTTSSPSYFVDGKPVEVLTGSTNFTESAFYGQSNVGHIVRDEGVAQQYLTYCNKLALDPPGRSKRHSASSHDEEAVPMDEINKQLQPDPAGAPPHDSITVFFSPRKTSDLLDWYADRMGDAADSVHFTAAFGVSQPLAHVLNQDGKPSLSHEVGVRRSPRIARRNNTDDKLLRYILLDSQPSEHSSEKSRASAEKKGRGNDSNRIAYGAVLSGRKEEVEDGASSSEHSESLTGLSTFVDFVHTKFMMIDALTNNPTIITGSANFSIASIEQNEFKETRRWRMFTLLSSCDCFIISTLEINTDSWMKPFFDPSHQLFRESCSSVECIIKTVVLVIAIAQSKLVSIFNPLTSAAPFHHIFFTIVL
jgi:phosphatidylserine/phosphatidylglycerophosphate/cardiolipin synthase-like enzyme